MLNKLVIFDLDGVLIDSRELHYDALNEALKKVGQEYVISREEHLSTYDGLNTTRKLELLSEQKGLDRKYFNQIWQDKQNATFELIRKLPSNNTAKYIIDELKKKGWKVAVASNSIRETIRIALDTIGILGVVDYIVSNEDVKRTKPFPEMYWKCMTALNTLPKNTIIIEDSHIGRQGAIDSGAILYPVENANDLIVQKDHYEKYNLKYLLNLIAPNCKIVQVEGITEGAACTTLLAKEFIDNDAPLVMANSDQFVEWNSNECMYAFNADAIDGGILTFKATHPKWSYAKIGDDGFVSEVAEKKPISDNATVGVYFWKKGSDYVKYAEQMIANNIRTNNEFYVCPVFNEAIADGKKVRVKQIEKMWGIGTPEDLNYFLENRK